MASLEGKTALVTGSAQGIGKSIAVRLAQAGASVIVSDTNQDGINLVAQEIRSLGRNSAAIPCNVADSAQVEALTAKALESFPSIDILVNNAGVTRDNLMIRMDEKEWDLVIAVNLKGTFLMTKAVAQVMMRKRYGRIVNIASVVGLMGNAGQANYAASKAGVIALTKSVAKEFASRNITCNAIAPGFIETAMTQKLPEKVREDYKNAIPLRRFGTADDVAATVLFLAGEDAAYMTGQVLTVDGGMFMR
jgi:3-oxoacyl-[acyl-carrier protein] reductase